MLISPSEQQDRQREGYWERGWEVSSEVQLVETWAIQTFLGLKGDSLRPGPPPLSPLQEARDKASGQQRCQKQLVTCQSLDVLGQTMYSHIPWS